MSGWRREAARLALADLYRGGLWALALVLVSAAVNVPTSQADNPDFASWEPALWELSSSLMILAAGWLPWAAISLAPPDEAAGAGWRPKARFVLVHAAGLTAFSAIHVAGFVALRKAGYVIMGAAPYVFGDRAFYEFRKDIVSYVLLALTFWLAAYLRRQRDEPVRPVSFDIRDGARIIRVPLDDILAVSSALNYVEFRLADGRQPLMRATLAAVEAELERFGFVRTHRSWLVNASRVTGLVADGSGDWRAELGRVEAPVSRRYRQALARLRNGSVPA